MKRIQLTIVLSASYLLSGTAYAQVTSEDIENNTIRSTDIRDNTVSSADIRNKTITGADIENATIIGDHIKNQSITGADIKNGSITLNKVHSKLSNSIGTYCPVGESVVGMDQSGNFVCESADVDSLEAQVVALEAQVAALLAYLEVDTSDPSKPVVRIVGANLQVVNGLGDTDTKNGVGNLIVGYDEGSNFYYEYCSDGSYGDYSTCLSAGETWGGNQKSGSHYIVLGRGNSYTQYSGLVAGYENVSNGIAASVLGGYGNKASGSWSSVSGGYNNVASGEVSSVSGGWNNTASGDISSVSGGFAGIASGDYDWVAGSLWQDD